MTPPDAVPSSGLERRSRWLADYGFGLRLREQGSVVSVGDGIAWISGLPSAAIDELLEFADGSRGLVFHLGRELLGAILLHETQRLTAGCAVFGTARRLGIPAGDELLGRVVDPLGTPLDGLPAPQCRTRQPLDALSPPIVARDFVDTPLYTGTKIVDALIPIGRGQRQLIIGDNGVGKTTLAVDAVLSQRGQGVRCVYALIGQKRSGIVDVIDTLREAGAMEYSTVVVAEATALPGLKYLAPFAGCAIAEAWAAPGRDTLVVYDDLTTHARTYRELSLLLRRPPGREAYPGDIFYLHSRLLERATRLSPEYGGGSITALPIVETEEGEIAAYIPTNLISITDGQIYFDRQLFAAGVLPAIDITRSVSRIGGKAQHARIRAEAGRIKLDYLQFLELEVFTRFGARVEASVEARIRRGRLLRELLKQEALAPATPELQLAWLIAFNDHLFDPIEPSALRSVVERVSNAARERGLRLDDPREEWAAVLRTTLEGTA
ncbi:MAG: F0F1 ATP synthase subunit alpha [Betaproteobacteria bacterium]|nr:MAG: F0F1 ATP synthase subunit alpha [Betaproteobacteria bacterium]